MAEETTAATEAARDTFAMDIAVTRGDGVTVPVTIRLEYPAGLGLTAISAITHDAPGLFEQAAGELLHRGDAETVAAFMLQHGDEVVEG